MNFSVVDLLCQLVNLPSVNPMGRAVEGPEYLEGRVADFLVDRFREWNFAWERHEVSPGRDNLLVRVNGADHAPTVLLDAHLDTVPVEGMTIPPFTATLREGRVYGRGACDIKGGLAAMLATLVRLAQEPVHGRPHVVLACTVNEEFGFTGATHIAQLWSQGKSQLLPAPPHAAIVAEPTLLNVVVAHKGVVRWKVHTVGRATHSSRPELGENAIYAMGHVLAALEENARNIVPNLAQNNWLGRPSLSVGTITGGLSVNTVPDGCTIEIDRRLVPGETPAGARQQVMDSIEQRLPRSVRVRHEEPYVVSPGLAAAGNENLAERLQAAVHGQGRPCELQGVPYGTNAAAYAHAVPCVVFGPGSIDQAHTADEWLAVDQLEAGVEVLHALLSRAW